MLEMKNEKRLACSGQGTVEYALIIGLVAVMVIAILFLLGPQIGGVFSDVSSSMALTGSPSPQATAANAVVIVNLGDFRQRVLDYYHKNGRWPSDWGDRKFTDIGLNPADWSGPVEGIYWNPHGDDIGLANRAGDTIQIYVNDLNGNTLHLYDGWNIWCPVTSSNCYYHTVASGNEVDINTISAVQQ